MYLMNWFYVYLCICATEAARLHLYGETIGPIFEEENGYLTMSFENDIGNPWKEARVKMLSLTPQQISIENETFLVTENELETGQNVTVKIHALLLGRGKILIGVYGIVNNTNRTTEYLELILKVNVVKKERVIDEIFVISLAIFIIIINIYMGCVMDLNVIKEVFRKPTGVIIGFCSQSLFMSLSAYGYSYAFFTSPIIRLGLFTIGCCPGGTASNFWTLLLGGDFNLSIVMTFLSTVAALALMPLWLFTLGREFFDDIQVPYASLIITIASLILPIGAGLLIRRFRPSWAKFSEKFIRPFTVIMLLFFAVVGTYSNFFLLQLFTWQIVMASVCLAWGGFVFGALVAWLFCMKIEQVIAISIETAFQNPGMAFVLLKLTLPQPDADLACLSVIAKLLVTGLPCWIAYIVICTYKRLHAPSESREKNCFRNSFAKKKLKESDVEELDERKTPNPNLWISVPVREEDEQDGMIRSNGDGEEDIVWQR